MLKGRLNKVRQLLVPVLLGGLCLQLLLPGLLPPAAAQTNPFLAVPATFDQAVPYDQIKAEDYLPAIKAQLAEHQALVDMVKNDPAPPTFANTIRPLHMEKRSMAKAYDVLLNINEVMASPELEPIVDEASALYTEAKSQIAQDPKLFARVKTVYETADRSKLTPEEQTLLEKAYRDSVNLGVNLPPDKQRRFNEVIQKLQLLGHRFDRNLMTDSEAAQLLVTEESRLAGVSDDDKAWAAELAAEAGKKGWLFTYNTGLLGSILTDAKDRTLRQQAAMISFYVANNNNANDNKEVIREIVNLRLEQAELMGEKTFAAMTLRDRMAQTPGKVNQFLKDLSSPALPAARQEMEQLSAYVEAESPGLTLEPWDYSYYTSQLHQEIFGEQAKGMEDYLPEDRCLAEIFKLYGTLYNLEFRPAPDIPVYHPDVKVYQVWDTAADRYMGLVYFDLYTRDRKRGGAYANMVRYQYRDGSDDVRPHAYIVCNFTAPTKDKPCLLSHYELTTLLHETGHGMHILLSDVNYAAVAGYEVQWDFAEMPSTMMENFAYDKNFLKAIGQHYQTKAPLPQEYLDNLEADRAFMANRYLMSAVHYSAIDMGWYTITQPVTGSIRDFERQVLAPLQIRPQGKAPDNSVISVDFTHLFSGGYAAAYYGYLWAEALSGSAYERLRSGTAINKAAAAAFRQEVLSRGGSESADVLFARFDPKFAAAGRQPDPSVILRMRGLQKPVALPQGFVYLDQVLKNAVYDVRYYGSNNFLGKRVDGYLAPKVILTQEAAQALAQAEKALASKGYQLKVFDGFRPQRSVNHFVRWAEDLKDTKMKQQYYPEVDKKDIFRLGYIAAKSGHSRGSTVDLTIVDAKTGQEVDMGSGFDFFGPVSHHGTELITPQQTANRNILKDAMLAAGFKLYDEEWWHYTLQNEPYPNSYFDFAIR